MWLQGNKGVGLVGLGIAVGTFLFFHLFYPYHLFLKEQVELFLYSSNYLVPYFSKPAWLSCLAGDFLTQFNYLRGGGPIVLSLTILAEWALATAVLKRITSSPFSHGWALWLVAAEVSLNCSLLYGLPNTLGNLIALAIFLGYASITHRKTRWIVTITISLIGYWLIGNSAYIIPMLAVLNLIGKNKQKWLEAILMGSILLLAPIVTRHTTLLTLAQAYLYPNVEMKALLATASIVIGLATAITITRLGIRQKLLVYGIMATMFSMVLLVGLRYNANFDLEKILALDSETYFGNTEEVINLSKNTHLENKYTAYYTNMAMAAKGNLPNTLFDHYQPATTGLTLEVSSQENWINILMSNEVFYLMGEMNLAQHSSMLATIFSPNHRSSRLTKRLAEINIVNGDTTAALRYLRLLDHTLFHKKWAAQKRHDLYSTQPPKWLTQKRSQIPDSDHIYNSSDHLGVMNFLVSQKPGNTIALDYLLCFHLLNKDIPAFMAVYDQYGKTLSRPMPNAYAEALLIYLFGKRASEQELVEYGIPNHKVKDFITYTQLFEHTQGDLATMKNRFGKTYWFYHHFAKFQEQ